MSKSRTFGGSVEGKYETVTLAELRIDPAYQRGDKGNQKFIEKNFNRAAAGTLIAARRGDGSLWLLDGQQRTKAMIKLGIARWRAQVIESSGAAYEASLFVLLNGKEGRRGLSPRELFSAHLTSGDPVALAVKEAVEGAGCNLRLSGNSGGTWPDFGAVALAYRFCKAYGGGLLRRALDLCNATWPRVDEALNEGIVGAVCLLLIHRGDRIDEKAFVQKLGKVPPRTVLLTTINAVAGGTRHHQIADTMISIYNKKLHARNVLKLFSLEKNERQTALAERDREEAV